MVGVATSHAPRVRAGRVLFSLPDPDRSFNEVLLYQEIERPRLGPPFVRTAGGWRLDWPAPDAARFEYLIHVVRRDGYSQMICDPNNPLRAPGPFGNKSVVELPGYAPPLWVNAAAPEGSAIKVPLRSQAIVGPITAVVWTPDGYDEDARLPLLVVHDGPEYAEFARLLDFLRVYVARKQVPPVRAALVPPIERNQIYSASAMYGRALTHDFLPQLARVAPVPPGRRMRAAMGASLGALALLHAHRLSPASFGGLFLQSGSYFRQRFDKQESGFVRFRRISRFVGRVITEETWAHPVPVTMTCGHVEENRFNNRAMRDALVRQGYEVSWSETPDAHNWTAWRDSLEPHLATFLSELWNEA